MSEMLHWVEGVKVIDLQPGDVIAVEMNRRITKEQGELLKAHVEEAFPEHRVILLPPDFRLVRVTTGEDVEVVER